MVRQWIPNAVPSAGPPADKHINRAAELLTSLPETDEHEQTADEQQQYKSAIYSPNHDPEEAALEAKELSKYLLAKSFFDCREFDRCAAVFLPDTRSSSAFTADGDISPFSPKGTGKGKGKGKAKALAGTLSQSAIVITIPKISQKSLFLALYAKFLSGEKRKNEESEMVMGPQDLGTVTNRQLLIVGRYLSTWFEQRTTEDGEVTGSQGWLEYL